MTVMDPAERTSLISICIGAAELYAYSIAMMRRGIINDDDLAFVRTVRHKLGGRDDLNHSHTYPAKT